MGNVQGAVQSKYFNYGVNENIDIYKGDIFIMKGIDKYRWVYYKMNTKTSINFNYKFYSDSFASIKLMNGEECYIDITGFEKSKTVISKLSIGKINYRYICGYRVYAVDSI